MAPYTGHCRRHMRDLPCVYCDLQEEERKAMERSELFWERFKWTSVVLAALMGYLLMFC